MPRRRIYNKSVVCKFCGNEFIAKPHEEFRHSEYCSPTCRIRKRGMVDVQERFWKFVNKTNECWIWTGAKDRKGYGQFDRKSKFRTDRAHRVSYLIHFGEFDRTLLICHTCDNPSCVNPAHLFAGTHQDNANDMIKKNRSLTGDNHPMRKNPEKAARGYKNGAYTHPESLRIGSKNGMAKLKEDDIKKIRTCYPSMSTYELAVTYNVSSVCIQNVINRKTWKHLV